MKYTITQPILTTLIEEYTNLHDQFPPKLDESTSSEFCFTLVSTWLSECKSYHPLCKSFEDGLVFDNDQLESRLPTRLIEVGSADGMQEPRLVDIADLEIKGGGPRYIALSHRWGSTHLLTTTLGTIGAHRSTIPLATMPRTFRDAIVITRRLGIQFLWIDSLCIIQDSSSDWKSESLRMQNIYNFAHLTISAAHSTDSSSGCFRPRRGQLSRWIPYYCEDKEIPSFEYCLVPRDPYHDPTTTDADKEPLYKRGWVLQEQLLSRRTLVYSYNGLRWECLTARGSESMPKLMEHADPNDSSPRWTINGLQRFVLTDGKKDHHRMWLDIVEDFCCRDLTIAQDALAAIAGVANSMARVYGMDYLAGLWKQHLGKGLLWQLVQNDGLSLQDIGEDDRFGKIAPSWSWASASRKVKWTGDRVGLVRQTILIEVLDTQGFDSALSSVGSITLRGRAQKHKHYQSSYFPDCLSKSTTPQTSVLVFFVDKIASNHSYNTDPTIFTCLVLVPSEVDGAWQRVGLAKEKISEAEYLSLEIMDIIIV
ncbi:heterokaryon incompatibility protein-domain-containing protein [Cadophora sp. MPI-SDFR-AT-0126]|nr:heterokaryon incompatibility protein-domain-containing protein [Leotiomycetes sp. MPI-SDFR-AT-0126]